MGMTRTAVVGLATGAALLLSACASGSTTISAGSGYSAARAVPAPGGKTVVGSAPAG